MATNAANTQRLLKRPMSPFRFRTAPAYTSFTSPPRSLPTTFRAYSAQPPRGSNNSVKFWPFLAIIGIGTAGYVFMIKSRADSRHAPVRRLQ
ncbi:uncharacterized protein F4822DRAFT_72964 [Hypoxylon trugodes]|uniref:uncharacterized protein n=1 Tax=Hypoxylon trugodes TaxID=326681 RepID=UPI00219615B8|nr:uncharacterized protein F4822DRAFT_72964 [Hypoxylon trugodes]KAI1383303.1 hypothetical protein F4822DRAFT_72964 [Hypoxylon trugodes]